MVSIGVLAVVAALAMPASAQDERFTRALTALRAAQQGAYGDEGPDVAAAIDDLRRGLAEWDGALADASERLQIRLQTASGSEAADAHIAMGALYFRRHRFADAAAQFDLASRAAPQQARPALLRALALEAAGRTVESPAAFRHASSLDTGDVAAAYLALARSADAPDLAAARETLLTVSRTAVAGGAQRQTFPDLRTAMSGGMPVFPPARYAGAFALFATGEHEAAIARLREAAAHDPLLEDTASRTDRMRAGAAALRGGDLSAAIAAFRAATDAAPGSSEAHRMLGIVLGLAGRTALSVQQFDAALRIRGDDERSWMARAQAQADAGSADAAASTLSAAVKGIPDSGAARWALASLEQRRDRNWDALRQYQEAARLPALSGRAAIDERIAALSSLRQDLAGALAAAEARVDRDLDDPAAHRELSVLYVKQGRPDAAFREAAIAAWLDPDDALTLVALAQAHIAASRDADAVEALTRAVALAPDLREARYALGQTLTRVGRRDEGRAQLAEYQRLAAESTARDRRADELAAMKHEAAEQIRLGKPRLAIQLWTKVIAIQPEESGNYLELAEALVKAGDARASIPQFAKAAELNGVAEVHRRIADVLASLGRTEESALARQTYERLRLADYARSARR